MLKKNTVSLLRPAKIVTTAIPSAGGAYPVHFSVDDSNLTQMDLICFRNLLPELWAEENFVTLHARQSTLSRMVKDC